MRRIKSEMVGPESLHWVERLAYWMLWIAGVAYAIYRVYLAGLRHVHQLSTTDFGPGWWWAGGTKDTSDYEWDVWSPTLRQLLPYLACHVIGSRMVRCYYPLFLPYFYVLASTMYLFTLVGPYPIIYLSIQAMVMFVVSRCGSRLFLWGTVLAFLMAINFSSTVGSLQAWFFGNNPNLIYVMSVAVAWTYSRSLSFGMDRIAQGRGCWHSWHEDMVVMMAYVLYLPLLLLGPLITFEQFEYDLNQPYKPWTGKEILILSANVFRYAFWMFVNDLILHYIYFNALQFEPELVTTMGLWEVCGMGYCLGQFFMTKYVVFFGFPALFARAEGYTAPAHPKCIGRIHLYSDMWKHFDGGLYTFLVTYIYKPVLEVFPGGGKLPASFLCFAFVFLWHGIQDYVFIWSLLNFLGITLEAVSRRVSQWRCYRRLENKTCPSPSWVQRWRMMWVSPLLMMSALSNFYFFAGKDTGDVFVKKICWEGFPEGTLIVLMFLYCTCHVGSEMAAYEAKKAATSKKCER